MHHVTRSQRRWHFSFAVCIPLLAAAPVTVDAGRRKWKKNHHKKEDSEGRSSSPIEWLDADEVSPIEWLDAVDGCHPSTSLPTIAAAHSCHKPISVYLLEPLARTPPDTETPPPPPAWCESTSSSGPSSGWGRPLPPMHGQGEPAAPSTTASSSSICELLVPYASEGLPDAPQENTVAWLSDNPSANLDIETDQMAQRLLQARCAPGSSK